MDYSFKKGDLDVRYQVKESGLDYEFNGPTQNASCTVNYETISNNRLTIDKADERYKYFSIILYAMAALSLYGLGEDGNPFIIVVFLILAATLTFLYYAKKHKVFTIESNEYKLFFLDDEAGNVAWEAIKEKRNQYLKEMYSTINWENDHKLELKKFNWLKDLGVLSEEEHKSLKNVLLNK